MAGGRAGWTACVSDISIVIGIVSGGGGGAETW